MALPENAPINGSQQDEKAVPLELNVELGTGPLIPGGASWLDWMGDGTALILNKPLVTLDQLVEMRRRDGQSKALTQLVTLPLRLALQTGEWIEPEDGDAAKETEFANQMWTLPPSSGGMSVPRGKLIRQILLSLTDGFAAFEIVRTCPTDGPLKGKYVLRKLAYRDPRTITFKTDKHGGYAGFRQVAMSPDGTAIDETFEPAKTLTFVHHDEMNPFYGVSAFESAYPHFDAKRKLYYIAHLAAQFAAVPGRIGKIPPGARPSEVLAFVRSLQEFAFNTSMALLPGYEVDNFSGSANFDFMKLIDHHNLQMSKSILASFFDNESRTVLIENTGQDAKADMFLLCLETMATDVGETLTHHLMPQFINFNFDSKKYPVFKPGKLSDHAREAIKEMFNTVVVSSILNSTPEFVRELEKKVTEDLGLDIDYEEIEKREKEAAEQQAAMAEEQAKMQAMAGPLGEEGAPPGPGGPPAGPPGPSKPPGDVAAMTAAMDELVAKANELFLSRPDMKLNPVDAGI